MLLVLLLWRKKVKYKTLEFHIEKSIGYIKFSKPPQNRMTSLFFKELFGLINEIDKMSHIRGLIILGDGRHFSSGADTDELINIVGGLEENKAQFFSQNIETFSLLENLKKPTVALVKGCCFGAALELALTCNFIISSKNAVFSMPESEFGLMPGCGGTIRFTERIGMAKSTELIISGRTFDAEEGLQIGVVDYICRKNELMELAEKLISKANYENTTN